MSRTRTKNRRLLALAAAPVALLAAALLAQSPATGAPDDGACPTPLRTELEGRTKFDDAVLTRGEKAYKLNCASCHGDQGKGDGVAGKVLKPSPRNFSADQFKKGMDAFSIFGVLTKGLEGTQMPAFDSLAEDDRWAITHYVRERLMPAERRVAVDTKQLDEICVGIAEERNRKPPIPVDLAARILIEEEDAKRKQPRDFGSVRLSAAITDESAKINDGVVEGGKLIFGEMCADCHGDAGQGVPTLARFGRVPYVELSTRAMMNHDAGGTWKNFAERSGMGVHRSLPTMAPVATLSVDDWRGLQAFVSTFQGSATITTDRPPVPPRALLAQGEGYEVFSNQGKFFKLVTNTTDPEAPVAPITTWAELRGLLKAELPEAAPEEGVKVTAWPDLPCIGLTARTETTQPGCVGQDLSAATKKDIIVWLP